MLEVMKETDAVALQVFVEAGCEPCQRAVRLAEEVDSDYPQLMVEVIDVSDPSDRRDDVFAVPTFVLNGQLFSLGNPRQSRLRRRIESLLRQLSV